MDLSVNSRRETDLTRTTDYLTPIYHFSDTGKNPHKSRSTQDTHKQNEQKTPVLSQSIDLIFEFQDRKFI